MQITAKVQLLKNTSGAILCGILAILERNYFHDFEKYNIPGRIYFSCWIVFRTHAYCDREKAVVRNAIQVIRFVLAVMCFGKPG